MAGPASIYTLKEHVVTLSLIAGTRSDFFPNFVYETPKKKYVRGSPIALEQCSYFLYLICSLNLYASTNTKLSTL
jgi:hypothetical protein